MSEYVIEDGIPLPPSARCGQHSKGTGVKGLLCQMKIGQSILFQKPRPYVSGTVASATKKSGYKYATRKLENGIRVWRIA